MTMNHDKTVRQHHCKDFHQQTVRAEKPARRIQHSFDQQQPHQQHGFSLIEMLIVVACVGIIMAISLPRMRSAFDDARQSAAFQNLRGIVSAEHAYHMQNRRFARLSELSAFSPSQFGVLTSETLTKSSYTFQTTPATPTDPQLISAFTVTATTTLTGGSVLQFLTDQGGRITQTLP
jgi:prepilin-type N-terminal cleavage/methylation domain-containing protein